MERTETYDDVFSRVMPKINIFRRGTTLAVELVPKVRVGL